MKILLTSGGTRTYVDDVRILTNLSSGTFGNHLCHAFLEAGHEVIFLYAKGSKCPHELRLDLSEALVNDPHGEAQSSFAAIMDMVAMDRIGFLSGKRDFYHPFVYADFNDYSQRLTEILFSVKPDIVVLAAAVSDYAPVKREGKISSELKSMEILLEKTPKLIRQVKNVLPDCFLVGFKLLVGSTQSQLEDAMADQMKKADCDMVVGNDLRDIKASKHILTTLSIDNLFYQFDPMPGAQLAKELVDAIVMDAKTMRGENEHLGASGRKIKGRSHEIYGL